MNATATGTHGDTCTAYWSWVVVGALVGFGWMSLFSIGVLVLLAAVIAAAVFRVRLGSRAAFGAISGVGLAVMLVGALGPAHRAAPWYLAGACLVLGGALAFAAANRLLAR
jgi:hypothetical protein